MSFWSNSPADAAAPLLIGHRGAPEHVLENTAESFKRAMAHGADAVETDLRLTSDHEVVCLHDGDLLRVAGSPDAIGALTLAAARKLFPALLTFPEFLDLTNGLPIIVDVKYAASQELDAFIGLCRRHGSMDRALFTAYTPEIARLIRAKSEEAAIGTFFPEGADCLQTARDVAASWIRVLPKDYQPEIIEGIRAAGLRSMAVAAPLSSFKTATDAEALSRICELKIDGVITDNPQFAAQHFRQRLS